MKIQINSKELYKLSLDVSNYTKKLPSRFNSALREATDIIVERAKTRTKGVAKGKLSKTILRKKTKKGYIIGFSRAINGTARLAHLFDKGTGQRYTKKGKYTGKMKALYFWGEFIESQKPLIHQKLITALKSRK